MIDKDKLIKDLEEKQNETMKEDTYSALGEFRAYAYILRNINKGKYIITDYHDVSEFYKE